ncbi:MAG: hypothetical protein KatS3mg035_0975 [Bacteroidia bacterium]|nr:MAG: hypothetical protein KatS3mg035_0975 [Bacteroidia bacterium]
MNIITKSEKDINDWLDRGWRIVSVTAQSSPPTGVDSYNAKEASGKFCFVIEKIK